MKCANVPKHFQSNVTIASKHLLIVSNLDKYTDTHRKLTCCSSLRQFTGLHQGALFKKFKENNLAKVSLLTKENLLLLFH